MRNLLLDLVGGGALQHAETVQVLDLGARAELRLPTGRTEMLGSMRSAPFSMSPLLAPTIAQHRAQRLGVGAHLGRAVQVGLGDDFQQRHARPG